ncbi:O-antigen ligase family protein [Clostridium paridis]|uniref:O-antigen ligase family protein n=1 Tax=Clostridium paridis TaxID=2803863 RepID=A0A937FGA4_9CLOT|nr:O-antigen ligase family protein [Clostridium paridis]MBL4932633.1 O-antigen ligase family protein [Clostridium paridis]
MQTINTIIMVLISIIPVTILGDNLSNWIIILLGIFYLLKNKPVLIYKKVLLVSLGLLGWSVISILIYGIKIDQIASMGTYIVIPLYYLVFKSMYTITGIKEMKKMINITVIATAVVALGYILYLGIYYNVRVYGNLGYANSYALLILILLNINCKFNENKYGKVINVIYMLTILYTGSRTTLILLVVNILYIEFRRYKHVLFETFIVSLLLFVMLEYVPILGIVALPLILYLFYEFKGFNKSKILCGISIILITSFTLFLKVNTFERIGNISSSNGSLQERLLTFSDVIKNLKLFGYGIGTFQYKQFKIQSGFYDIKYIHNSILHTSFELGIVGGILLAVIIIMSLIKLYKNRDFDKVFLLLIIVIHSMMDFDFIYSPIIILLLFTLTYDNKVLVKERYSFKYKIPIILLIFISTGVIFNETILRVSYLSVLYENFNISKKISEINLFHDWRIYQIRSDSFIKNTHSEFSEKDLKTSEEALINGLKAHEENVLIKWNLAYVYEKLNNSKGKELRIQLVHEEKYNSQSYKEAYKYIKHDEKILPILNKIYSEANGNRSFRTKYLKNQLGATLEDTLKD